MKIIAITNQSTWENDRRYLVELTNDDLTRLMRLRPKDNGKGFQIGEEIELEPLKRRIEALEHREREIEGFYNAFEQVRNAATARRTAKDASQGP